MVWLSASIAGMSVLWNYEASPGTAAQARDVPPAQKYGAIQHVLNRELQAIWLTGKAVKQWR